MLDETPHLRIPYLLRVVRMGVICTLIVLVPIAAFPLAPGIGDVHHPVLYYVTVGLSLAGVAVVVVLPWERMLARGWGEIGLYIWSIGDITLITLLVVASGGVRSPLWAVYALTTLFFAASYPRRGQFGLFTFTIAAYLAALLVADPSPLAPFAGDLVLRMGVLATVAIMADFIASELSGRMAAQERRARASQRIADAASQMSTLERRKVMDTALRAAADIGFPVSAVVMFEGRIYRIVASTGLPEDFDRIGLTDWPTPAGEVWTLSRDEVADPAIVEILEERDLPTMVLAPLHVASEPVGAFVACGEGHPTDVEAIQMLSTVISSALENAELYRLKTDFVANVSHELRTPLTVIAGLGETMRRQARRLPPESIEKLAVRMEANAERLGGMISALLDFSELETRQRRAEREHVDVADLVVEAVEARRDRLAPRPIAVTAQPGATAVGDTEMLRRVVDNLLDNIADHTPPETHAEITVAIDDGTVSVTVADDGPGLPPTEAGRATQRFYRGGDHRTRRSRGLGLGLALAQEIIGLHGGQLEIRGGPDGGTEVRFGLPRAG